MLNSDPSAGTTGGIAAAASLLWLLLLVGLYVWYAWGLSRAFPKLGVPSRKAWIPFVNEAEIFKLGGFAAWNVIFYLLPVVFLYALYLRVVATHRINARFGKGAGTTVLAVVAAPVWASLLAAGRVQAPTPLVERIADPMTALDKQDGAVAGAAADAPPSPLPARPASAQEPTFPRAPYAVQPYPQDGERTDEEELRVTALRRALPEVFPWDAPASAGDAEAEPDVEPEDLPDVEPEDLPELVPELEPEVVPELEPESEAEPEPPVPHTPWAPTGASTEPPDEDAPRAPVEIAAPPVSLPQEMKLSNAAISALVASVREPFDYEASEAAKYDDDGVTIVVDRKPSARWILSVDGAGDFPLTAQHVLLGRKPATSHAETQALPVPDLTRTLSKLHARLDLTDDAWTITDLNSTNGVLLVDDDGEETLIEPGSTVAITGAFVLGKVGMSIHRAGDDS